ncbi:MAG: aminopeptidase N, partial [Frankiaceae bacterium]|nr:aminopeptidase N [Arenimonas sp.]
MSQLTRPNLTMAITVLAFAFIASPIAAQAPSTAAQARAENAYLSQADAAARSARVSKVSYALDFMLTGEPTFKATSRIDFMLSDNAAPLTVDLDKAKISALTVNGKAVTPKYNQWFITLDAADLKKGRNSISVSYEREHGTGGEGLHRYVDKTDGRVYLYSHFEPAAAHQMFALFDQPDLKATYQLNVSAPKDWEVISSTRETGIRDNGATRQWTFPATPVLSPYNFSLHAGPYKKWEDNTGKYPMRLFARQSVASQVSPADWFRSTKAGLIYFDEYFGIPYPFKKYDQVLVPQFIYGAMENAAAVTFTENSFLSPTGMTAAEKENLFSVILHEMAHQWFGDLVTMKWWNGLWLNESFASYMSTLGSTASPDFHNTWLSFYRSKQGAYRTDDSITTHPIEVPVASTANAFDNIDAITYSKGAATLHQLRKLIGDDAFRRGVHNYLAEYAYRNATLEDFIGALSKSSGRDLAPWAKEWLYLPGLNKLAAEFTCSDGRISSFNLAQSAAIPAFPTLREQLVQVALFNLAGDKLVLSDQQSVTYRGANTAVPALVGKACPDLVYPNYDDWGFVKVVLDPTSFATARSRLASIDDPMLRSMMWQSLTDGLSDRRLGLDDFIQTVITNTPKETDSALLRQSLGYFSLAKGYLRTFAPGSAYDQRVSAQMEKVLWDGTLASRGNRERGKSWLSTYIPVASSDAAIANLSGLLAGTVDAGGLEIDQEFRWDIIQQLNRIDVPGSEALIARELERDKTENGQLSALSASTIRPDAAMKAQWLAKLQKMDGSEPFSRLRVVMGNLYPASQAALAEPSAQMRLDTLPQIDKTADPVFLR